MSENKISVSEYLNNNELLEIKEYIPYAEKVNIVDSIMRQVCRNMSGLYSIDSVLLDRVKKQIFIEQLTNLDLSILSNNLDGYDLLMVSNDMEEILLFVIDEYKELDRILELRVKDFLRDKTSISGFLHYKTERVLDYINSNVPVLLDRIDKIDTKSIIDSLSKSLDMIINFKKK